jgi:peptide deformylase
MSPAGQFDFPFDFPYLTIDFGSKISDADIARIKEQFAKSIQSDNWKMPIFLENDIKYFDLDMTKNHLIIWPDERLKEISKPVDHLSKFQIAPLTIEDIAKGMFQIMYDNKGVGLSAIQIGVALRMFVMDCSKDKSGAIICINPVIKERIGELVEMDEGCLSFPGIFEKVLRYDEIIIECEDLNGEQRVYQLDGLEAQCVAHEIDHLDGRTMADTWGRVKRGIMTRKVRNFMK